MNSLRDTGRNSYPGRADDGAIGTMTFPLEGGGRRRGAPPNGLIHMAKLNNHRLKPVGSYYGLKVRMRVD